MRAETTRHQQGASAIEFGLILPLLIALTYSIFVYSYTYVVAESINYAAQQGAEAAVQVDPALAAQSQSAYLAAVQQQAQIVAASVLSWLPEAQRQRALGANGSGVNVFPCPGSSGSSSGGTTTGAASNCPVGVTNGLPIVVTINFPLTGIFPAMTLPLVGRIPPLPDTLQGTGVTLLSSSGA